MYPVNNVFQRPYSHDSEAVLKRVSYLLVGLVVLTALSFTVFIFILPRLQQAALDEYYKSHILGGFSIDTPERAANAAADGVQVIFKYGQSPSQDDNLGQDFQALHMKVIDGYIWTYLYYYECHRTAELKPSLLGVGQYCQKDPYPSLTNENMLLAAVVAHLKKVKDNPLIIGYWVLDDWVQWDAGSARPLLIKIHQLIQQYTLDRPAICGFGGSIELYQEYAWADWIADNFSPQGCDKVGFYIYAPSLPNTTPTEASDAYDWSMSGILPAMFTSLQQRGWTITKEPLIGIVQAFGGPIAHTDRYWVTPTARDIETESRSFCEHGATGLTYYAWNDSGYGPESQTPMNSPQITIGIQNGIAACKALWDRHLQKSSQVSQEIVWSLPFECIVRRRYYGLAIIKSLSENMKGDVLLEANRLSLVSPPRT